VITWQITWTTRTPNDFSIPFPECRFIFIPDVNSITNELPFFWLQPLTQAWLIKKNEKQIKTERSYFNSKLYVSTIISKFLANTEECQFLCMSTARCVSINVKIAPNDEGLYLCELLAATKDSESDHFGPSERFHHFTIPCSMVSVFCFVCQGFFGLLYFFQDCVHCFVRWVGNISMVRLRVNCEMSLW